MTSKNIFILGDSYSTFEGYNPEGYDVFYSENPVVSTDVTRVEKTWWHRFAKDTDGKIVRNSAFSGTTVCNTGYGGFCPGTSFVGRFEKLVSEGFFRDTPVDLFFVFGGTNDAWANSPIGELKYSGFSEDDLRSALPAFCYLLQRIRDCVPGTRIVNILNDVVIKSELTDGYREACRHLGVECVEIGDFDRMEGHPTALGMEQIENSVLRLLEK